RKSLLSQQFSAVLPGWNAVRAEGFSRWSPCSVLHVENHVCRLGNNGIVGDEDDAAIFFVGQPLQNPDNIPAVFLVQIAGRLVGQDDLAACRQGSCDGDPLLLTAGQGGG